MTALIKIENFGKQLNIDGDYADFINKLDLLSQKYRNRKLNIFFGGNNANNEIRLSFAPIDANGQPDRSEVVSILLPCPPFCGDVQHTDIEVEVYYII